MAIEKYVGNPPENIVTWIRLHAQPADHPETIFTLQGGTVEEYNIEGQLNMKWLVDHGYYDGDYPQPWMKTIVEIDIGNTVTSIESYLFYDCSSISNMTIPNSVTSIGEDAFCNSSTLTSIVFKGKTLAQVQSMDNYPWGIDPSIISAN